MKSISKRIISFALSVFMLICISINLSAFESEYQRGLAVLRSAGWSDEDISDLLTYDVVCSYAGLKLVDTNQTYYRVTENSSEPITKEECLADLTASDSALYIPNGNPMISPLAHGDTWKNEITTTDGYITYFIQVYDAGSGIYVISGRYEWLAVPGTTLTDIFAIGCEQHLQPNGPIGSEELGLYYIYKYDALKINGRFTYEETTPDTINIDGKGIAVSQKLASPEFRQPVTDHRGFLQYKAIIDSTSSFGSTTNASAYYIHQKKSVSITPSIDFTGIISASINLGTKYQLMSPNPYVLFLLSE